MLDRDLKHLVQGVTHEDLWVGANDVGLDQLVENVATLSIMQ